MRLLSSAPLILIAGFIASATAGTVLPVEFAAESRLSTSAAAHQSRSSNLDAAPTRLNAGQKSEVMRDASGGERSQCGDAGRISRSESRASAEFFTGRSKFDLVLSTDLRAQGGYFTVGAKIPVPLGKDVCVIASGVDTSASAESKSEASVEIRFGEEFDARNYWLDLNFESKSTDGRRKIELIDPEGQSIDPVSGEPILLQGRPNAPYILRASFEDSAKDFGKCCSKAQKGTLRVSATIRPASTLFQLNGAGGSVDISGSFANVGLLITRSVKGEPVPVCIATVIGKRTLLTAAHCLTRFGDEQPTKNLSLWFLQNASVRDGLRRVIEVKSWSIPIEYVENGPNRKTDLYSRSSNDIAAVYVTSDVGEPAILHNGEPKIEALLSQSDRGGSIVNYRPHSSSNEDRFVALSWERSVVDVQWDVDRENEVLSITTNDRQCGAESGSPVFTRFRENNILTGILVSGLSDCSLKIGPRIENHIAWLRSKIR